MIRGYWLALMYKPSYTRLLDGPHPFTAWGTDAVGHKSAPASQSWIQDRVAPAVTITSHPANPATAL